MALGIPLPGDTGEAFLKGTESGGQLFSRLMQPRLQREHMAQQKEMAAQQLQKQMQFHQDEMALRQAAAQRAAAMDPMRQMIMQQQLLGLKNKNDPMYEINQYKALEDWYRGQQRGQQRSPQEQALVPTQEMGEGMGMFSPEGLQVAQQQPMNGGNLGNGGMDLELLKAHPGMRAYAKKHFGIDPLEESPEQKRTENFQQKMNFENFKTENKSKVLEQQELGAVKKDLPTLEKSLKGVDELLRIAHQNPEMFGHGFMPERYAKTTKLKDFGKWQNLISDAIAGLEQKLSARGNIVALKMAANLKPSHAEQQDVAIGKLESMRGQLMDSINNSRNKLGQNPLKNETQPKYRDQDLVIVEGPHGEETMTYAQAKALGAA